MAGSPLKPFLLRLRDEGRKREAVIGIVACVEGCLSNSAPKKKKKEEKTRLGLRGSSFVIVRRFRESFRVIGMGGGRLKYPTL